LGYLSNIIERSFPRGFDVKAFTFESFKQVHQKGDESHQREYVTPYYHEHAEQFNLLNVTSEDVFDEQWM
jgi:spore coat polysaccharide biosynthesis protein SpsF